VISTAEPKAVIRSGTDMTISRAHAAKRALIRDAFSR
jgi:hypothetical protein